MGKKLFDQYSYIHFFVGILSYIWGFDLTKLIIIHTVFEISENTTYGMYIINKFFYIWPGGKKKADSIENMIGDTLAAILGWLTVYYIDHMGEKSIFYKTYIRANVKKYITKY